METITTFAINFYGDENYSVAQTQIKKSRHFTSSFTITESFLHVLRLLLCFLSVKVAAGSTSTFWAFLSPDRKHIAASAQLGTCFLCLVMSVGLD